MQDVLHGSARYCAVEGDCLGLMRAMPEKSVDLVFGSPPYERARLYLENGQNKGIARKTEAWVAWMVEIFREASRVCRGLVAMVVEGQTKNYRYSCGPLLLAADLCRAGFNLRKPPIFRRVGIPGSGGPDWLRNDFEWIICVTPPGKLIWSDNTACGHPPKWAPGGEVSHRTADGRRVNDLGFGDRVVRSRPGKGRIELKKGESESDVAMRCGTNLAGSGTFGDDPWGKRGRGNNLGGRKVNGEKQKGTCGDKPLSARRVVRGSSNGDTQTSDSYNPPAIANPGNVITCRVGGGLMGHKLAHENEAPFPEKLADFFVKSFCPPGGIVLDPFVGSGTTLASAVKHGRRGIGIDLRASQVAISLQRLAEVCPPPGPQGDLFEGFDHETGRPGADG
jgi:hypothetical protein